MSATYQSLNEIGLDGFCADLDDPPAVRWYVDSLIRTGLSRPDWCWVVIEGGRVLTHQVWWTPVAAEVPLGVNLLRVLDLEAAVGLLGWTRERLALRFAVCQLLAPTTAAGGASLANPAEVQVLEASGFRFAVSRVNLEWTPAAGVPRGAGQLSFRRADEVPDATLVALFAAVGDGSVDHAMRVERAQFGRESEAQRRLARVRGYRAAPEWFRVGVDSAGVAVGYVVPALAGEVPMIGDVGVADAFRDTRYVDELLAEGLRVLAGAGAARAVADVDVADTEARAAFRRAGFRELLWRDDYEWRPAPAWPPE